VQLLLKVVITVGVVLAATAIGRKLPTAAGLIAVMPITGAMVLIWLSLERRGDPVAMATFAKGALWGILPSVLFFLVALVCFQKHLPLSLVLACSFGAWLVGAIIHQLFLR